MPNLVGTGLNQVPTNGMLGGLAYQSPDHASIKDLDLKNLSQINSEIADTAVDIFIYDTSKDSDGGAWRHRTSHTSWYNEELNTTTRGSRREFPAVAVIVAETAKVTIYDGDDPDMPMWMVYTGYFGHFTTSNSAITSVYALNGWIFITTNTASNNHSIVVLSYPNDIYTYSIYDQSYWPPEKTIKERGIQLLRDVDGASHILLQDNPATTSKEVNDVAMTVLPNAPIDPSTGLPTPTIAVATNGGVSVIKDDGTVVDIRRTSDDNVYHVSLDGDRVIMYMALGAIYVATIPSADQSGNPNAAWSVYGSFSNNTSGVNYPAIQALGSGTDLVLMKDHTFAAAGYNSSKDFHKGLSILSEDVNSSGNGMVAWAHTDFNTGWMHGDIKGAFLSGISTASVTGSELITNGDSWTGASGSTPPTGWTGGNGATFDVIDPGSPPISGDDGVVLRLINAGSAQGGPNSYMYTSFTTVVGQSYTLSLVNYWNATISVGYKIGTSANGAQNATASWVTAYGDPTVRVIKDFVATATTTYLTLFISSGTNGYGTLWDDVSIRPSDPDRSVNQKGLAVYGTITKSAVATGAELVAYSNFSGSNYLEQPYNSDLDFGTGDFSFISWVKHPNTFSGGHSHIISKRNPEASGQFTIQYGTDSTLYLRSNANQFADIGSLSTNIWQQIAFVRRGGVLYGYKDGNLISSDSFNDNISNNESLRIGCRYEDGSGGYIGAWTGSIALLRVSASAPSAEQIKKIYEDEKVLFQENAACTLYGSSDAVTALAYDEVTERLHVGTSSGRSEFQGLRRINNTTTAVTTAISAYDSFVVEQ